MRIGATTMFRYRLVGARLVILSNAENDSNIVQNNMFIIKGVVSGHYSHISQFTYKCIMWTVIINEDEEGRYVYRSEIWQALKFDFHK